jgi:arylsulfatase
VPKGREKDYTLNENLADKAIEYIHQEKSVTPERPFFIYYAPGATHAPHHVPEAWIAKFKGQFDQGWDKYREETFQRQLRLGVIPAGTKLTPRPAEIPAWDTLTPDQKKVEARLMEVFAAFTAQTDYEVGRVIDAVRDVGQSDNTLILWQIGDNGASMEGTLNGVFNEMTSFNDHVAQPADRLSRTLQQLPYPDWRRILDGSDLHVCGCDRASSTDGRGLGYRHQR